MTYRRQKQTAPAFGFAAEMRAADFATFTRWYDRRCLLPRPGRAECEATFSAPATDEEAAAPMRAAA